MRIGLRIVYLAHGFSYHTVEFLGSLCSEHRVVVLSPLNGLWPKCIGRQCALHALDVHHGGHASLGMDLAALPLEIDLRGLGAVWPVACHAVIGRTTYVTDAGRELADKLAQFAVDVWWRIAFVTPAVEADGGMLAYAAHIVLCIVEEHALVVGVGSVGGIGEPEVLPEQDAEGVADVVELVVTCLPHPVADHGAIHVFVVGDGSLVVPLLVLEVVF